MPPVTNTEKKRLLSEFKKFAFDFSPMFRRDAVQGIEEKRKFIMSDEREIPIELHRVIKPDITVIEVAFNALRRYAYGGPTYEFSFGYELSRTVEFDSLPQAIAESAVHAYCRMETGSDIEDVVADMSDDDLGDDLDGDTLDIDPTKDLVDDLIADLRDDDTETEISFFKGVQHSIDDTYEFTSKFEAGYAIDGQIFYSSANTDVHHDSHLTRRLAPPRELFDPDGLDIEKEHDTLLRFERVMEEAGLKDRNVASFETFEDVMKQVRFIMQAFRTGELDPDYIGRVR